MDPRACPEHATCHNSPGSYYCFCNPGFVSRSGNTRFLSPGGTCEGRWRDLLGNQVQFCLQRQQWWERSRGRSWLNHSFIHSFTDAPFDQYFLSIYNTPGSILGMADTAVTNTGNNICSPGTYHLVWREIDNKK